MWLEQRLHAMLQLHPRYKQFYYPQSCALYWRFWRCIFKLLLFLEITNKVLIIAMWNWFPPERPDPGVMLKSYFQDSQGNTMRVMETYQCGGGNICLIGFTDHCFCILTLNWWSLKKIVVIYAYTWVHKCLHMGDYWSCILMLNGSSLSINFVCIYMCAYAGMHLSMHMGERIKMHVYIYIYISMWFIWSWVVKWSCYVCYAYCRSILNTNAS